MHKPRINKFISSVLSLLILMPSYSTAMVTDRLYSWTVSDQTGIQIFIGKVDEDEKEYFAALTDIDKGITPTFARSNTSLWVSWVDRSRADHYKLMVGVIDEKSLALTYKSQLTTVNKLVYAPSIMLDSEDLPWLAWTEFDGEDEEVFVMHLKSFNSKQIKWSNPIQLTDNHHPDSLPAIGLTKAHPVGVWWKSNNKTVRTMQKSIMLPNLTFSEPTIANPFEKIPSRRPNQTIHDDEASKLIFNLTRHQNTLLDPLIEITIQY